MFFWDSEINENIIIWLFMVFLVDWFFKEDIICFKFRCKCVWDGFFFSFWEVCLKIFFVNYFREFIFCILFILVWFFDLRDRCIFLVVSNYILNLDEWW